MVNEEHASKLPFSRLPFIQNSDKNTLRVPDYRMSRILHSGPKKDYFGSSLYIENKFSLNKNTEWITGTIEDAFGEGQFWGELGDDFSLSVQYNPQAIEEGAPSETKYNGKLSGRMYKGTFRYPGDDNEHTFTVLKFDTNTHLGRTRPILRDVYDRLRN